MPITSINSISPNTIQEIYGKNKTSGSSGASSTTEAATSVFGDMLDSLNKSQVASDTLIQQMAAGEDVDLHNVMIASEENDVNFRVAMSIRDKLVEAYREVMRMNV